LNEWKPPETAGFGILGMQKRAREVGGLLNLNSTPGQGTCVEVGVKFEQEKPVNRFIATMKEMVRASATDASAH
jgi:signal transduction histidine kinase